MGSSSGQRTAKCSRNTHDQRANGDAWIRRSCVRLAVTRRWGVRHKRAGIAHDVCHDPLVDVSDPANPDWDEEANIFKWCKSELVHFDYAGLSHQVVAERQDPYLFVDGTPDQRELVGDRYVSTYLYGPLGLVARTAEIEGAMAKRSAAMSRRGAWVASPTNHADALGFGMPPPTRIT